MKQKNNLSMKDKLTIRIKKTHPMKCRFGIIAVVVLLALLIVLGRLGKIESVDAPAELSAETNKFRVTFSGDIEISDSVRKMANKMGYDSLFDGLVNYWDDSDCVVTNVSGPVLRYEVDNYTSKRKASEDSVYVRPAALRGFTSAGIDLISFANDDAYNYGKTGLISTMETVKENGLEYFGIAMNNTEPLYVTKTYSELKADGTEAKRALAIFAINDDILKNSTVGIDKAGIVNSSIGDIYAKVYEASTLTDNVVVYIHFKESEGQVVSDEQKVVAQSLIDAGADVVVGNSRELQKVEQYNNGIIFYGLGSIITDEVYSMNKDAALLDFVVNANNETKLYITPVRVTDGRPEVTDNKFYLKRIHSILTSKLDENSYHTFDNGVIEISLGVLGEPVYVEPTVVPTVAPVDGTVVTPTVVPGA